MVSASSSAGPASVRGSSGRGGAGGGSPGAAMRGGAVPARRCSAAGETRNAAVLPRSERVAMRAGLRGAAFSGGRSPLPALRRPGAASPGARGAVRCPGRCAR